MEYSGIHTPEINKIEMEKKAKKIWKRLNEDRVEIKFITTPMGLLLMAAGIGTFLCLSKKLGKIEQKCAIKHSAKQMAKELTKSKEE